MQTIQVPVEGVSSPSIQVPVEVDSSPSVPTADKGDSSHSVTDTGQIDSPLPLAAAADSSPSVLAADKGDSSPWTPFPIPGKIDPSDVESGSEGIPTLSFVQSLTKTPTQAAVPLSLISRSRNSPIGSPLIDTRSATASNDDDIGRGGEQGRGNDGGTLSAGAISGIVIGILLLAAVVAVGLWFMLKKDDKSTEQASFDNTELSMVTDFDTWTAEPMTLTNASEVFTPQAQETAFMADFGE
jgi:hypothetical protein